MYTSIYLVHCRSACMSMYQSAGAMSNICMNSHASDTHKDVTQDVILPTYGHLSLACSQVTKHTISLVKLLAVLVLLLPFLLSLSPRLTEARTDLHCCCGCRGRWADSSTTRANPTVKRRSGWFEAASWPSACSLPRTFLPTQSSHLTTTLSAMATR